MTTLTKNFLKCGLAGWCLEITFTAADAWRRRDMTLKGSTSLWMFPIYGCAAFLAPLGRALDDKPILLRGLTYMSIIYSVEYFFGVLLGRHKFRPWDYVQSRWNVGRVIRLDFAPFWFVTGLLFERILSEQSKYLPPSSVCPSREASSFSCTPSS